MIGSPIITSAAFDAACKMIQRWEGFRSAPYRDAVGVWTIAWGFCTLADGSHVTADTPPMTVSQALAELTTKLRNDYAPGVETACAGAVLPDAAWTALLDFAWNLGDPCLEHSGIGPLLSKGNLLAAAGKVRLYDKAGRPLRVLPDLERRRAAEADMILGRTPEPAGPITQIVPPLTAAVQPASQPTADALMEAELGQIIPPKEGT